MKITYLKIKYLKTAFTSLMITTSCLVNLANAGIINILENSGFETGNFDYWTITGTSTNYGVDLDNLNLSAYTNIDPAYSNVRSGSYSAWNIVSATNNEYVDYTQTVDVLSNTAYDIGFFLSFGQNTGYGDSSRIYVNGTALSSDTTGSAVGTDQTSFRNHYTTFTTAANMTSMNVKYRVNGSGTFRAAFSVDDFYVNYDEPSNTVPEPSTLAIFALGMIGLASRRFKKQS